MSARIRSLIVLAAFVVAGSAACAPQQEGETPADSPGTAPETVADQVPALRPALAAEIAVPEITSEAVDEGEGEGVPEITKEVVAEGKGDVCGEGRAAVVHYVGTFKDGKKFDSSRDRDDPFVFEVGAGSVIEGWDEVVAKMRVGDRWTVVIPWQKAYGDKQNRDIPAKSDLVFDMELLEIVEPAVEKLVEGKGDALDSGSYVSAHITLTTSDGKELTNTRNSDPGILEIGGRMGITGVDMAVKRMKVGDHWKITVPSSLAFGKRGRPPRIGPNVSIVADIKIIATIGLDVEILKASDGAMPKPGQTVKVHYVGTFKDGTEFDSSRKKGTPFQFMLGARQVIPGWDMMLAKMHVGERVKVTIPWQFAYGAQASNGIPAKSDLVFDIELLGIE